MVEAIRFEDVCVDYGKTRALADFSLSVEAGQTVALLGPSGSGKSTALKALAGFERPASGRVYLGGRDVTDLPPYARGLGVVVQQYALFPHLRVHGNVAFGLRARRLPRAEIVARVRRVLDLVGMREYARRYPAELSGGQQQRVAIARALAISPDVLLLDEPLSALDAKLRQDMIGELQNLRRDLPGIAMLYVTHDQVEALSLAQHIVVMDNGRAVDSGPAALLYRTPPSPFTASFLGDANLLPATVIADGQARAGTVTVSCSTIGFAPGDRVLLCLRPHELRLAEGWTGRLEAVQWRGATYRLTVSLDDGRSVRADVDALESAPDVGEPISLAPRAGTGVVIAARGADAESAAEYSVSAPV